MKLLLSTVLLIGGLSVLASGNILYEWDSSEGGWKDDLFDYYGGLVGNSHLLRSRRSSTTCNCGWTNKGRIVGGKETKKNAYPMIAALQYGKGEQFCGGTIITPWHVLTAAHCTKGERPKDVEINVGAHNINSNGEGVYKVKKIIIHEKFNMDILIYDISLIVTASEMKFSQNVGPACLPTRRLNLVGQKIKALGWGDRKDGGSPADNLNEVDLRVIGFKQCFETWNKDKKLTIRPMEQNNMCTLDDGKDTCQGDSGGPLIWLDPATNRYNLVALVSYGGVCGGKQAAPNTDVSAFLPWINKHIQATKPGVKACTKS